MGDELGLRNDHAWEADPARLTTTAGCTGRRWTGRRPSAAGIRTRSRVACGRGCAGWWPRAAPRARPTRRQRPSRCGPATTTSSASLRSRAGQRLLLLANFTPERQPVDRALIDGRGLELTEAAAQPDGRPVVVEQDALVLEPYQYLWLRG